MRLCRSFDLAPAIAGRGGARAAADAGGEILGLQDRARRSSTRRWSASAATATSRRALLARLYREAPVNAIWEGSGNVMALDVLRAFARDGEAARAVLGELAREAADLPGAAEAAALIVKIAASDAAEAHARLAVERLAQLAAAAALKASAPAAVAASFARTRLAGRAAASFGTSALDPATMSSLLERALPPG